MVVKLPQIPDDVVCASTYFRFRDVHYVLSFASERQHVEFELDFIAVQLEGDRTRSLTERKHKQVDPNFSVFQTFSMRAMVAFRDFSKSFFWMLPDVSSKM